MSVIDVQHLCKVYPGKVAVDDISFSLHEGEIFGLLGPNGSGKTTTILMILGLLEPTAGSVTVLGKSPLYNPLEVKRLVGYLPDTVGFYDNLTLFENLDYTASFLGLNAKERKQRIDEAFEVMHLADRAHQKVKTLSHGLKQRLGLAEILVKQPKIAILDEPTQGLDPASINEFLDLIRDFRDTHHMSVLFSSHQLVQAQEVCDRVGLFSHGDLIDYGSVAELSEKEFGTDKLIAIGLEKDAAIESILAHSSPEVVKVTKTSPGSWLVESKSDIRPLLVKLLVDKGMNLTSIQLKQHSLDDIYAACYKEVPHAEATA